MGRIDRFHWILALALAFVLPAVGAVIGAEMPGTSGGTVPKFFGTFTPQPGVWSEYDLTDKDSGKKSKMRTAIVGQEGDSYWYEVVNEDAGSRVVIKMLVKGNPNDPDNIQRQIIKSGDQPAQEMPRDFVVMGRKMAAMMFERRSGVPAGGADTVRVEEVGERDVKVPAGTLKTTERKIVGSDGKVLATSDFNPEVRPFGVVRSETESTIMELTGYGTDAKSAIAEDPVRMTAPRGMPAGMPRGMPPGMGMGMDKPAPPKP
ncbi:MAG: hypothetical protein HZB55_06420 [Deltaproteobacteria bacterium]|nr:hypothetical protein [Deltaproteobacteria bacterium]